MNSWYYLFFFLQVKQDIKYIRGNITSKIWHLTNASHVLFKPNWTENVIKQLQVGLDESNWFNCLCSLLIQYLFQKCFEGKILTAMKTDGWDGIDDLDQYQWTLSGALFYSIIVITTIGMYKNLFFCFYLQKMYT